MTPFYINAIIASFLLYIACNSQNKALKQSAAALCVTIPCLLAALRAEQIGTDTSLYGMRIYFDARSNSLINFMSINPSFSSFYNLVAWILSRLSPSLTLYLFIVQLVSIVPVVLTLKGESKSCAHLGYLIYLIVIFPITLNMIRQGIAQSLILAALSMYRKDKYQKSGAILFLAVLTHRSALIGVALLGWYILATKVNSIILKIILILSYVSTSTFIFFFKDIVGVLTILIGEYAKYLNQGQSEMFGSAIFVSIYIIICLSMLTRLENKKNISVSKENDMILYHIGYLGAIMYSWAICATALYRPSLYLICSVPLTAALTFDNLNSRARHLKSNSIVHNAIQSFRGKEYLAILILCVIFAQMYFAILGQHQVFPYKMR